MLLALKQLTVTPGDRLLLTSLTWQDDAEQTTSDRLHRKLLNVRHLELIRENYPRGDRQ